MEKVSKAFEEAVKSYLDRFANNDDAFAVKYANEGKSIGECCDYIASQVKEMGVVGLSDDEVYGLAVHYYDEEDVRFEKVAYRAVCNRSVELTDDEKSELRRRAMEEYQKNEYSRLIQSKARKEAKPKDGGQAVQLELF